MRVRVYKDPDGNLTALVTASPGHGKPPVVVGGITAENVVDKITPVLEALRGRKLPRQIRF